MFASRSAVATSPAVSNRSTHFRRLSLYNLSPLLNPPCDVWAGGNILRFLRYNQKPVTSETSPCDWDVYGDDVMMTVTNNAMMVMTKTWFLAPLTQWCDFALPHLYNWPSPSHLTLLEPWNQLNTWWMMMMLWDDDDVGDVWCYDKVMMMLWWWH